MKDISYIKEQLDKAIETNAPKEEIFKISELSDRQSLNYYEKERITAGNAGDVPNKSFSFSGLCFDRH